MSREGGAAPGRRLDLELPEGWEVREVVGPRPFVTGATLVRPDGSVVEWTSRRHRKRLGLRERSADAGPHRWLRPLTASYVLGGLFAVGAVCFAVGSLPAFSEAVSIDTVGWTFFVGSLFFTAAAFGQYRESITAPLGPEPDDPAPLGFRRAMAWAPHRLDWWIAVIQLTGTIAFNVSTWAATRSDLSVVAERQWIWAPDVVGSVCFLVSSWGAYVEAGAGEHGWRRRSVGGWISILNLAGSVAFGAAAVGGRYLQTTGEIANIALVNLGTFTGAVCFLVGAALLPVESAWETAPGSTTARPRPRGRSPVQVSGVDAPRDGAQPPPDTP